MNDASECFVAQAEDVGHRASHAMLLLGISHGSGRAVATSPSPAVRPNVNPQKYKHASALYGAPETAQDEFWPDKISSVGLGRQSGAVTKFRSPSLPDRPYKYMERTGPAAAAGDCTPSAPNDAQAVEWYKAAAKAGSAEGQYSYAAVRCAAHPWRQSTSVEAIHISTVI